MDLSFGIKDSDLIDIKEASNNIVFQLTDKYKYSRLFYKFILQILYEYNNINEKSKSADVLDAMLDSLWIKSNLGKNKVVEKPSPKCKHKENEKDSLELSIDSKK